MTDLLEPKNYEIDGKTYVLSKFPAMDGVDIVCQYGLGVIPKLGDYAKVKEMRNLILSYVGVQEPNTGNIIRLTTRALINNHCASLGIVFKLEWAMWEYNCSDFLNGRVLSLLKDFAQNIKQLSTETLMDSAQS